MKRFLLALALIAGTPVVAPDHAARTSAALAYGYYRYSDGVMIYTFLWQWPGIWTLVNVEPA